MFARRRGAKRFSLLLLDEEEDYVQDWVVQCRWPPSVAGNWQGLPTLSGRIRLCTRSLFFEPDDVRIPIVRFPFTCAQALEAGGGGASAFTLATTCLTKMKTNMEEVPYGFEKGAASTWIFSLSYAPLGSFLSQAQELFEVSRLPKFERNCKLEEIVRKQDDASSFDASRLIDFGERLLFEGSVVQLSPLVREHGRLVVTEQRIYFQPQHNVAGDIPVRTHPLAAVAAVARRRSSLRPLGLEVFFIDSPPATFSTMGTDGDVTYTASTDVSTLSSGPLWDAPSAFFAFRDPLDRDRALSVMLAQKELGRAAPQMSAVAFEARGLLLEAEGHWLHKVTLSWQHGSISNFDYLLYLNIAAGRSFNDLAQWPVFPWVLSNYTSHTLDLDDPTNFRDLSKPVGALNPTRLHEFRKRYHDMPHDSFQEGSVPPFLYGTHYSTPGYTMYWLVRAAPAHMLKLQNGRFDAADRLFSSIHESWESVNNSTTDVKELIPEFFLPNSDFLINLSDLPLGCRQSGCAVGDVQLPPWATSPDHFLAINRAALEAPYVSEHLHLWIDLIFGHKQRGLNAVAADNLFYHLTYEGAVDVTDVTDPVEVKALEVQINEFGQTPKQLFLHPHPPRIARPPASFPAPPDDTILEGPSCSIAHGSHGPQGFPSGGAMPNAALPPSLKVLPSPKGGARAGSGMGMGLIVIPSKSTGQVARKRFSAACTGMPGHGPAGMEKDDGNRALTLALVHTILAVASSAESSLAVATSADGFPGGSAVGADGIGISSKISSTGPSDTAPRAAQELSTWQSVFYTPGVESVLSGRHVPLPNADLASSALRPNYLEFMSASTRTPSNSVPTLPTASFSNSGCSVSARSSEPLPPRGSSTTGSALFTRSASGFGASSLFSGLLKLGRYTQPQKKLSGSEIATGAVGSGTSSGDAGEAAGTETTGTRKPTGTGTSGPTSTQPGAAVSHLTKTTGTVAGQAGTAAKQPGNSARQPGLDASYPAAPQAVASALSTVGLEVGISVRSGVMEAMASISSASLAVAPSNSSNNWGYQLPDKLHDSSATLVQRVPLGKDPITAVAMARVVDGGASGARGSFEDAGDDVEVDYLYCIGYGGLLRVLRTMDPFRPVRSAHLDGDLLSMATVVQASQAVPRHPLLLVGSHNRKVYTYSVDQGRVIGSFDAHDDAVCCISTLHNSSDLSSGDARFATSSWDCSVKVWNMEEGRCPWSAGVVVPEVELREGLESGVWALAAGTDGSQLMVTGTEEGVVSGWDLRKPQKPTWQTQIAEDYVGGLCLPPCGKFVAAAAADGSLSLLDLRQTGARLAHVSTASPLRCCTTDGGLLVAGSEAWELQLWDVALMSASGPHVGLTPPAPDGLYRPWVKSAHMSSPINCVAAAPVLTSAGESGRGHGPGVVGSAESGAASGNVCIAMALDNGSLALVMTGELQP